MLHFECDYTRGCHPEIMRRLAETNMLSTTGYGEDEFCSSARAKIRAAVGNDNAAVWFCVGGTQTNATVISALLKPWEGVISATTGHVNGHEAGAIEHSGHKVITLEHENGKLSAKTLRAYLAGFYNDEAWRHIARPGMVYISFPTEYGTVYSQRELEEIHSVCREYAIPLFIDGARLGYGLCADGGDVTLESLARECEVFYVGGTKVGALFGEAVVFTDKDLCPDFFTAMKQQGAVLAKGRLLGVQFDTLFTDGLYLRISQNAVDRAGELKKILRDKGYRFHIDSPTNQVFPIVSDEKLRKLKEKVNLSVWEPHPDGWVIRLCTDWATTEEEIKLIKEIL